MIPFKYTTLLVLGLCMAVAARAEDDPAKTTDVTAKVTGEVKDNKLSITANNDLFGDPADGVVKRLRIEYTIGDEAHKDVYAENQTVEIAPPADKKLTIKKAVYGALTDPADVTKIVSDAVKDGKLSLAATNDALGGDPAFGVGKQLNVEYTVGGTEHKAVVNENDTLELPAAADGTGALVIKKAVYGPPN